MDLELSMSVANEIPRITRFSFLLKLLWENAGFNCLRTIEELYKYTERWDVRFPYSVTLSHVNFAKPTVVPLSKNSDLSQISTLDPSDFPALPEDIPGRYRSVVEYHELYLSGELTPLAVAESLLPLVRRDDTTVSHHSTAFISCNVDSVLKAAKASTLRYKNGTSLGLLDGVPTAIKDESEVAGYRTTSGRKANDKIFPIAKETIWSIQQWVDAGVVIIGKTTMHEYVLPSQ